MVAQFRVVSGLDFIIMVIVIIIMSNFLVVLGCSDDDSVSLSSPTVPVMSVSVSPANSSSLLVSMVSVVPMVSVASVVVYGVCGALWCL